MMQTIPNPWGRALLSAAAILIVTAGTAATAAAPTVPLIDAAGLRKQVAARKNKVVVVNFWATWCGPCVEEFPGLVALQKKYKAKGMDLVTVSFDDPKDIPGKVKPFLTRSGLSTGTFVNRGGAEVDEGYLKFLEPKLPADAAVALPRTYIFSRSGKLVKTLIAGQTPAQFEKAVAPYLK
ncbi:MAG: TlpA family protein disulfide reductase [Cytophagales bacterium]|nr:TlpA family protein disulfide reductase [Armatimonadota bacterium]